MRLVVVKHVTIRLKCGSGTERIYRADPQSRCGTAMGDKMCHFNDVCFLSMFFVMGCKVVLTSYTPISIKECH